MLRVLVVDDDAPFVKLLSSYLAKEGFEVTMAHTGASASEQLAGAEYALVIVEVNLPDMKGWDLVKRARTREPSPCIFMVSAHTDDDLVIASLDAGADDFLGKPFSGTVLGARIRAVLRRTKNFDHMQVGDVVLDRRSCRLSGGRGESALTAQELEVLAVLMEQPGRVVTRDQLLRDIWGFDFDPGTSVLDVALTRVRNRLASVSGTVHVRSIRNVGVTIEAGGDGVA